MSQTQFIAAAIFASLGASMLRAQPEFHLIGTPTTTAAYRVTDVSENGAVVVGLTGTNGVWRWERGVGYQTMPIMTVPGGPCSAFSAYVSADGLHVVGDGGGATCDARVFQVYHWAVGSNPVIGPNNTQNRYFHVRGATAAGTAAGVASVLGDEALWSESFGVVSNAPYPAGIYHDTGCTPTGFFSAGRAVTPDGAVLGSVNDCVTQNMPGVVWRGANNATRFAQVPIAGSWGGADLVSETARWSASTGWVTIMPPGSVATDISWDGTIVTGDFAVGPLTSAGYVPLNGSATVLRTALLNAGVTQVQGLQLLNAAAVSGDGRWITGMAMLTTGERQAYIAHVPGVCGDLDYNNDGISPDTQDIDDFLCTMMGGDCCWQAVPACDPIDINMDGLWPDVEDIAAFLRLFSGGSCF